METKSIMVKCDLNTVRVLLHKTINGPDTPEKSKLIEMLAYYVWDSENFTRKVLDLSLGNMIPEPLPLGTRIKIDLNKTGWLSTSDREMLDANLKDGIVYGVVLKFSGYHGYSNYEIGFQNGTINLPMECINNMEDIL
jgi:hypothetical protein